MEQNEWAADAFLNTDNGTTWKLQYYIHIYHANQPLPLYGLRVEKRNTHGQLAEAETTPALTDSRLDAFRLAQRFAKGSVPPCTLLEMADEWA